MLNSPKSTLNYRDIYLIWNIQNKLRTLVVLLINKRSQNHSSILRIQNLHFSMQTLLTSYLHSQTLLDRFYNKLKETQPRLAKKRVLFQKPSQIIYRCSLSPQKVARRISEDIQQNFDILKLKGNEKTSVYWGFSMCRGSIY